ncbi:MAG: FG-GAP repeat protein [Verrucomicrobia bacterium]|nr:FG-GAP repeat protein [Verrucomicrobiota bacterium]
MATGTWQWGLELQSYGFAGSERAVSGNPHVNTVGPRVTYDWGATLQEWFVNDRHGLEHGFTVRERPVLLEARSSGRQSAHSERPEDQSRLTSAATGEELTPLTFTLAVRGGLRPEVQADGRGVRFVDAQGAAALTYSELTVRDADGRKLPAHFEPAPGSSGRESAHSFSQQGQSRLTSAATGGLIETTAVLRLAIDERGARYPLTIDPIAQQAYLKASNTGAYDDFGGSVAVSGDTVVVGAYYESSNATGVDGDQSDNSAYSSGAAYVFVRSGTTWTQQAYLKASNTGLRDGFGSSVAVSGDTVVVGAPAEGSNATGVNGDQSNNSVWYAGAAYVFVRNGTTWSQQAYLKASTTVANNVFYRFGSSVSVSGDTVVVGALGEASNATGVDGVGSNNSANNSGAAYVFVRNGTTWTQQAYLKASNAEAGDRFGISVAVSGDTVVIGADGEASSATVVNGNQSDNNAPQSGAAYVFVRNGTTWSQQAYLKASNAEGNPPYDPYSGDRFGVSVAVSGDTVVIGANGEDSSATGVNGNQSDNGATDSGAAYVFVRSGTTWTQQAYLKASNTDAGDNFGDPVSVSGDTVVIGAYSEDSNASGVNGNQSDNSVQNSGAAYVFVRNGTTWTQQAYLKASNGSGLFYAGAVSGDTVVVGAWGDSSNATGVNGDQSNNSASESGAAYIFTGFGPPPTLTLVPDGNSGFFINIAGRSNVTYQLQRAPSVTGPWSALVTNSAPASGLLEYHETSPPPGAAFYRTVQP